MGAAVEHRALFSTSQEVKGKLDKHSDEEFVVETERLVHVIRLKKDEVDQEVERAELALHRLVSAEDVADLYQRQLDGLKASEAGLLTAFKESTVSTGCWC